MEREYTSGNPTGYLKAFSQYHPPGGDAPGERREDMIKEIHYINYDRFTITGTEENCIMTESYSGDATVYRGTYKGALEYLEFQKAQRYKW